MKLGSLIAWAVGLLVLFLTARGAVWAISQDTPQPIDYRGVWEKEGRI